MPDLEMRDKVRGSPFVYSRFGVVVRIDDSCYND
jgi:hypothetical protein